MLKTLMLEPHPRELTCLGTKAAQVIRKQVEELCSKAIIALPRGPQELEGRG